MTRQDDRNVLRLYELERLEDATRETWPFWTIGGAKPRTDAKWDGFDEKPYMPCFPLDDAAAVKLAEKMSPAGLQTLLYTRTQGDLVLKKEGNWFVSEIFRSNPPEPADLIGAGDTLGEALLGALRSRYTK